MIISRTPVRISLFGGGTDYREYYFRKKGAVLGAAINKYVYVSINQLSDFFTYKIRVGYSKSELVNHVSDIVHPSVRECLKFKRFEGNLDVHIFSDLPARTGLGSSSSFTVGFLNALYALEGKVISKPDLAKEACHVEQEMIVENVGSQDQFHASCGGMNIIEFGKANISVRPVIIDQDKKEFLEKSMMLFYTGIERFASEVVKQQVENTKNLSKDNYLEKMYQMVFEAQEIISNNKSEEMLVKLGCLLNESWLLKKKLSQQVSNTTIDEIYLRALGAGAVGGKLCGAGSGGFVLLLVYPDKQAGVRMALKDLLEVKIQIDHQGSTIIYMS